MNALALSRFATALRSLATDPPNVAPIVAAAAARAASGLPGSRGLSVSISRTRTGATVHLSGAGAVRAAQQVRRGVVAEIPVIRDELAAATRERLR